jgi:hypothetical protein
MESHLRRGARVETADLDVTYRAPAADPFCRESL